MIDQVFVVGTGRCGSTLISNILRLHPRIASISEFFSFITDLGCQVSTAFPSHEVDGVWLWRLISTLWPRQNLMIRHDVAMDEVLYPFQGGGVHRFDRNSGVPAISQVTLPHLSGEPDALLDELEPLVCALPNGTPGTLFAQLFELLAVRQGSDVWVERSGGSLRIAHRLIEHFPRARFVHIVRDGRDVALSMSKHHGFKMVLICFQLLETLGVDPFVSMERRWEEDMSDDLASLLPETFSREAFLDFSTPPPLCGHYWSGEILEGLSTLDSLPKDRLLTLRYEDFLTDPAQTISRLIRYILPADPGDEAAFVRRASSLLRAPSTRWIHSEEKARLQLEDACQPGFSSLSARGLQW